MQYQTPMGEFYAAKYYIRFVLLGTPQEIPGYFRISLTASEDRISRALPNFQAAIEHAVTNALLSLWVIANAETLIGQEFSQLVYIFEFLSETHWSNPYVGELSEFSFERNFPRVTEER